MPDINVEKDGHILKIGVDRADKLNALTVKMYHEIAKAYTILDEDDELRVGLLYAKGDHFTAGLELTDWIDIFSSGTMPELPSNYVDPFYLTERRLSKPLVMAVQGYSYTWAIEMMLNTDVRVAAKDARFAQLEVQRGLFACGGATIRLQQEVGWANAQRYLLTGDSWSAEDAYRMGLIQELCEPGEQYKTAYKIARKIAEAAPLAVKGSLDSSRTAKYRGESVAIKSLFPSLKPVMESEDLQEGLKSFLERRNAIFKGC